MTLAVQLLGAFPSLAATLVNVPPGPNGEVSELNMSVYRESDGDKRFYFSGYYIDPGDPNSHHIDTHILFNKQFPGGGWQYSTSRVVYTELNSSIALGFEVTASSAVFRNPSNGLFYPRIMYVVKQPQACNGIVAGFLYVMFGSSDLS